jgi:ABC-type branched-subunit amino acid transport system substrate-binding protein
MTEKKPDTDDISFEALNEKEWDSEHKTSRGEDSTRELARKIKNHGMQHPRLVPNTRATASIPIIPISVPVAEIADESPPPAVTKPPKSTRNTMLWVVGVLLVLFSGIVGVLASRSSTAQATTSQEVPVVVPIPNAETVPPMPTSTQATERGVSDKEILLGMSGPFSGPARDMGERIKNGLDLAVLAINDEGGISGRKLRLVALDDGYTPDRAASNIKDLINNKKVFAILGSVGTPTAIAALPFAMENKTIFFGAMTGSDALRKDPPYRYVFHYRASYPDEANVIVDYLIKVRHLSDSSIAVFSQNDSYGDAGFKAVQRQLRNLTSRDSVLRVKYDRNSMDVGPATRELMEYHLARNLDKNLRHPVKAVVMVGTYKSSAAFIQSVRDRGLVDTEFYSLSFVEGDSLAEALLERGKSYCHGVTVMQVVPTPTSPTAEAINYRNILAKYRPDQRPGLTSFEGFIVMKLFAEGLRKAGEHPTTETVVEALENINGITNITGVPLTMSHTMHQASHKVWASRLDQECRFVETDLDQ